MQQSQQEYIVGIFGGFYNPDFSGWKHTESLKLRATSLDDAIKSSEEQVTKELRKKFNLTSQVKVEISVNYVLRNNKVIYKVAWDETSPLAAIACK